MFWRYWLCSVLFAAALAGAAPNIASAQSQNVTAALAEANKLMQRGGYSKAIEMIEAALRSGKIPSDLAARALLMRAEANEKLDRTAFALADYNQALWMESLTAADRKKAEDGRARVMKSLGAASPPGASPAVPANAAAPARQAEPPPQVTANAATGRPAEAPTQVRETPSEERTGGIGSIFGGLFGSSSTAGPREETAVRPGTAVIAPSPEADGPQPFRTPASPRAAAAPSAERPPAANLARPPAPSAARPPAAAAGRPSSPPASLAQAQVTPAAKPPEKGNFSIQFAALLEEDKAIYEADRIGKRFGADLNGRTPTLMIVPTSDGGTLYKVVAGPYETKLESQATCELLKAKGVSCMVITRK
jgi:hypothetical protein